MCAEGKPQGVECRIQVCPNGCITLGFGVAHVHLRPADFRSLLHAMQQCAEDLGLESGSARRPLGGFRAQN